MIGKIIIGVAILFAILFINRSKNKKKSSSLNSRMGNLEKFRDWCCKHRR